MKRSERDAWIAALRSGKYQQFSGYLRFEDGYCCLGVKCDIDGEKWHAHPSGVHETASGRFGFPDCFTLERWGLPQAMADKVAEMNDGGKSFAEIADWIEANVPVEED